MRAVDDRSLVPTLKACRPDDRRQPARDGVVVHFDFCGVQGGEGEGGVLLLMGAAESDRQSIERLPNEIQRSGAFRGPGTDDCLDFGQLPGGNDRNAWLDDAGFFARRSRSELVAEPFLMIVIDRGEDGDDRLGGVGRVETPAHAGLEHDDLGVSDCGNDRARARWQFRRKSDADPNPRSAREFSLGRGHDFVFGNHFAIDLNAFAKGDEMRRGEKRGAITRGAADGIEHRADGAFAVRPGDVNDPFVRRRNVERIEKAAAVLESELDPETLGAEKPARALLVG